MKSTLLKQAAHLLWLRGLLFSLGRVDELRKEDIYRDEMNKCYKHLG